MSATMFARSHSSQPAGIYQGMATSVAQPLPETIITTHRRRWLALLAAGLLLAGVCLLQFALGAFPTRIYGHDLFVFLNGAWRVASGQIPYVDFYSGLGVLVWKPIQWAFLLYGFKAGAIGLARALYTAVLGAWFLWLIWREPKRTRVIGLWLFLLIFLSAARPLGEYPTWISHAMFYNRVGYALVFLVIFEQLPVSRFRALDSGSEVYPELRFWRGFSSGAAVACTILLKISFFIPAAGVLGLGLLFFGLNRKHIAGLFAGALAVLVLAMAFLHFQPAAFLHETIILGRERQGMLKSQLFSAFVKDFGEILFTLAAGVIIAIVGFVHRRVALRYIFATLIVVELDIFCRATNAMRGDLPLSAFWCLSGVVLLLSFPGVPGGMRFLQPRFIIPMLVLSPMVIPIVVMDFTSSAYAAFETIAIRKQQEPRFASAALSSWVPLDWKGDETTWLNENGKPLVLITNDGLQLLRQLSRPQETVASISFVDIFSFALGRRPAQGGAVWLDPNNNVSQSQPLPLEMVIGRPDLLIVQETSDLDTVDVKAMFGIYPNLLTKDFVLVGKSEFWSLYRRRDEQAPSSLKISSLTSRQQPGAAFLW
jgi:hypothetical protein